MRRVYHLVHLENLFLDRRSWKKDTGSVVSSLVLELVTFCEHPMHQSYTTAVIWCERPQFRLSFVVVAGVASVEGSESVVEKRQPKGFSVLATPGLGIIVLDPLRFLSDFPAGLSLSFSLEGDVFKSKSMVEEFRLSARQSCARPSRSPKYSTRASQNDGYCTVVRFPVSFSASLSLRKVESSVLDLFLNCSTARPGGTAAQSPSERQPIRSTRRSCPLH
ncbi:hypothetical protein BJ742DRAFT_893231 [Cladochytrium replicatum]|nr:hypothetical protein BJ742DRAFT_893231 [Cladochytrium replicatum]